MSCECDSRINVGCLNELAGLSSLDFDMMVKPRRKLQNHLLLQVVSKDTV